MKLPVEIQDLAQAALQAQRDFRLHVGQFFLDQLVLR